MLNRMQQDDTHHRQSTQHIGHIDPCVLLYLLFHLFISVNFHSSCLLTFIIKPAMRFGSAQRLHLFRCQRNFLTQTACPRFSNQIIFLITDATEITVFLYLIIIDKISEFLLPFQRSISSGMK